MILNIQKRILWNSAS